MKIKKFYLIIFLLFLTISYTKLNFGACTDSAMILSIEYSLNDNSFSHTYDNTSGIIQKITRNESTGLYSLWQTSLLPTTTTQGYLYAVNQGSFLVDSDFLSKRNNMLILNPSNQDNFNLYVKLTLKNSGTCSYTNNAIVKLTQTQLRYYGVNTYNAYLNILDKNPNTDWTFTGVPIDGNDTLIFQIKANHTDYYGKLYTITGPETYQKITSYFWINGNPVVCGDNLIGYGETCDDGNTLNGDGCSNTCQLEQICGNGIVEGTEDCDDGNTLDGDYCTSTCLKSGVCGDGVINYRYLNHNNYWTNYQNWELCDKAFNGPNYNCSNDCQTIYSKCGNSITESSWSFTNTYEQNNVTRTNTYWLYYNPREQCDGQSYCNSSCQITYQPPTIEYLNYASNIFVGHNLTPLQNITYQYKITNNNSEPMLVRINLRLYNYYPFTSGQYGISSYLNYHNSSYTSSWYYSHYTTPITYTLAPNSIQYINQSIIIPDNGEEFERIVARLILHESIEYRPSSLAMGWRTITSTWRNGYDPGIGSYYPQYCISYLEPDNTNFQVTQDEDGIPSIEIIYNKGVVNSYRELQVPANTFYLKSDLLIKNGSNWEIYETKNVSINKTFQRTDANYISEREGAIGAWNHRPELEVEQKVSIPIIDYKYVNGKWVKFNVRPFITQSDTMCQLTSNKYESLDKKIELGLIRIQVDNPIVLRPKGGGGYNNLYARLTFFNYEDYSLFNTTMNVHFEDFDGNNADYLFDGTFNSSQMIPAGAAFPIPFKITYKGSSSFSSKKYKMYIDVSYTIPNNGTIINKQVLIDVHLDNTIISGSQKFVDLIPINLDYSLVNVNKTSQVKVKIANQGTSNSGKFDVDFYIKSQHNTSFIHMGTKTITSLNAGTTKTVDFSFTPDQLENYVLKIIVDKNNEIFEDNSLVTGAQNNNVLTSITMVRDIDVALEYVYPVLKDAKNGIIPFKVFAKNKGVGGIDTYEIRLNVTWKNYTHSDSFFFFSIPESGYENTFYWNVTNIEAHPYLYRADLFTLFDPDLSDNTITGAVSFCPLPWYSSVSDCFKDCQNDCLNKYTQRYEASCNNVNGCHFYNSTFAIRCNGYSKNSYVKFNSTHDAMCEQANVFALKKFSDEKLNITSLCNNIKITKKPILFNGLSIVMNIVECVD